MTLSDQPDVVLWYHIGAAGKSLASRASACWYSALASSGVVAAAASAVSFVELRVAVLRRQFELAPLA